MPGSVYFPFSGTTDASGTKVIDISAAFTNGEYAAIAITLALQGSPYAVISIDNGHIIGSGGGPNSTIKAIVPPTQSAVLLTISNGPVSTAFTATVNGWSDESVDTAVSISGASDYGSGLQLSAPKIDNTPLDISLNPGSTGDVRGIYGPFNCEAWQSFLLAYVGSGASIAGHDTTVTFNWFADQAQHLFLGSRSFRLDSAPVSSGANQGCVIYANLGPWLSITLSGTNTAVIQSLFAFRTNRTTVPEWRSFGQFWLPTFQNVIGAGGSATGNPLFGWGGPVGIRHTANSAITGNLVLQVYDTGGLYRTYYTLNVPASTTVQQVIDIPEGNHQVVQNNTGAGGGTFTTAIWPLITGAS